MFREMSRKINRRISGKLKNRSGESIAESLVGILIVALAMVALTTAIVVSARINKQAKDLKTDFTLSGSESAGYPASGTASITTKPVDGSAETTKEIAITIHKTGDDNAYTYYEDASAIEEEES